MISKTCNLLIALALALAGCGNSQQATGTAVLLSIRFADDVPEQLIEQAQSLDVSVSGAETFQTSISIHGQLNNHATATVRYVPGARSGILTFDVTANGGNGGPLGRGSADAALIPNGQASAFVLLEAAVLQGDMARLPPDFLTPPVDMSGLDLAQPDLSTENPDLTTADIAMPDLSTPDLAKPDLSTPDFAMPDLSMPDLAQPDLTPVDLFMCNTDGQCGNGNFCSMVTGGCLAKRSGGGDCTGDGNHACKSNNCVGNKCSYCPADQVYLPAGTAILGSDLAVDNLAQMDETPQHVVTFSKGFCADVTEVTVAAYRACVAAGACQNPDFNYDAQNAPNCTYTANPGNFEQLPIDCITWAKAQTFCQWTGNANYHTLGARSLPTEAQWEYQARGTDKRIYPWGSMPLPMCTYEDFATVDKNQFCTNAAPHERAVGSTPLGNSPNGTEDAAGNVLEWVSDWYGATYYTTACANGCTDPTGPANNTGPGKVIRGGSWYNGAQYQRCAARGAADPTMAWSNVGIRCVGQTF